MKKYTKSYLLSLPHEQLANLAMLLDAEVTRYRKESEFVQEYTKTQLEKTLNGIRNKKHFAIMRRK